MVGRLSVKCGEVTPKTGLVACAKSMRGTGLTLDAVKRALSRSQLSLQWASAVQGSLLMLLAGLSLLLMRIGSSLVLKRFPPGSYTNLPLSLVPKLLALQGWSLWLRLLLLLLSMIPMSLHVGLPLILSGLWLLLGTHAGSGFLIGLATPFLMLVMSVCSCVWRLFDLASVALVILGCNGDVVAIDKGGGGGSL